MVVDIRCKCEGVVASFIPDDYFEKFERKSFIERGYLLQFRDSEDQAPQNEWANCPCSREDCVWREAYDSGMGLKKI